MKPLSVRSVATALALLSAEVLGAGCDPYDELRCTQGYDWSRCQCIGATGNPPAGDRGAANDAMGGMARRASQDPRIGPPIPGTYQEAPNWSPDWELRSTDFGFTGNRRVRIFHARYKRDRSVQFTTYYDIDRQQWMNWQR